MVRRPRRERVTEEERRMKKRLIGQGQLAQRTAVEMTASK